MVTSGLNELMISTALPTFVGSYWVGITLSFTYIATHSSQSNRVVRFLFAEAALFLALATGNLMSSQLLKRPSWIGHGYEMRNYSATFILGMGCSFICVVWTILRVEFKNIETKDTPEDMEAVINNNNEGEEEIKKVSDGSRWTLAKEVLNPVHVIRPFQRMVSKRETPGLRCQILLLMICHITINLERLGMSKIIFSFTQRMFFWNVEMFSFISVASMVTRPVTVLVIVPILAKRFKLSDIEIAIVGVTSIIIASICTGAVLSPTGYYISIALGMMGDAANISVRSKMSRVIGSHEVTQIFGALTMIEVLCPFIASAVYINIFNATMATYPTLIIQISTVILIIPLIIFMYIDFRFDRERN